MPGDQAGLSAVASRGPYTEATALLEGQTPLTDRLGASACVSYNKDFTPDQARASENTSGAVTLRFRPTEHTEIVPFWTSMNGGQHAVLPVVYSDGLSPPPLFDARQLASQPFTSDGWRTTTLGVVARQGIGTEWSLAAGLFRAREQDRRSFVDEFTSVVAGGGVDHELDVVPPLSSTSTSGEVRLVRRFGSDLHEHKLDFSLRGRSSDRAYGGDNLLCYGATNLAAGPATAPPPLCLQVEPDVDETRQLDAGAVYEERWKGVGSLGVGLLKSRYRRSIRSVDTGSAESTLATPWLGNLRFTLEPAAAVTLYGSFGQGLEDSALAPYTAVVPGQPPPATRTRQVDGGLRYAPSQRLSLVLGAFEIQKVYFNLDQSRNYTALGTVRHHGLEGSLAYSNSGLTVVAGGVWLKPHVERVVAEPGATGSVPIGPVPLTTTLNLDYAPARWHPIAGSLQVARLSSRVATLDDQSTLPPLTTLSAGLRFESKLRSHPFSVRLDAMNLTNARGLHLTPVGQVVPELGRRFMLSIAIDH